MKRFIAIILSLIFTMGTLVACSVEKGEDNKKPSAESTTKADPDKSEITITSRNNQKPLVITYNNKKLTLADAFSSEVKFTINKAEGDVAESLSELDFSLSFASEITAIDDYNASMGDASTVIKLTELEKCILGNGKMIFTYDEAWYNEFKKRYFLYEKNDDLIKIIASEKLSEEEISYILTLIEF